MTANRTFTTPTPATTPDTAPSATPSHQDPTTSPPSDPRPRAHWRILLAVVASLAIVVVTDMTLAFGLAGTPAGYVVATVGRVVAVFGVLALTARWLDRRRLGDYGLARGGRWWADVAVGAAIGFGMFAFSSGVGIAAGWIEVRDILSPAATGGLWLMLALVALRLAAVSLWEEVLFRGVMIKNAAESLAQRWPRTRAVLMATAISTVVFAAIHVPQSLGAEGMSLARMAVMWVTMGGLLALPYVVTGQLGLSLGLHLTVNLALQHVFVLWEQQAERSAVVLHLDVTGADVVAGAGGILQVAAIALGYLAMFGWLRWWHGPLRIHPSLTRLPEGAGQGDEGADLDATSEGDTTVVVSTGCTPRAGR